MKYSVIDIGTNSTRLFLIDTEKSMIDCSKYVEITRIGKGVNHTRMLSQEGIRATIEAISGYRELSEEFQSEKVFVFATSAGRDSINKDAFCKDLKDATGYELDVIDGPTEAMIGYLGALYDRREDEKCLIIDIGGGSTELIIGDKQSVDYRHSFDIGAVRLGDMFGNVDMPAGEVYDAMMARIEEIVSPFLKLDIPFETCVGIGGTSTTQLTVALGMDDYDRKKVHGQSVSIAQVEKNLELFVSKDVQDRMKISGLEPKRADIIVYGTMILLLLMKRKNVENLVVSDFDNLEGYFLKKVLTT